MTSMTEHTMRLRLVAPFRCHFNVNNHRVSADEGRYTPFWEEITQQLRARLSQYPLIQSVECLHARPTPAGMRYHRLHESGSLRPPEILRVQPASAMEPLIQEGMQKAEHAIAGGGLSGALAPIPETLLFRLYDNTLGMAEVAVEVPEARWQGDGNKVSAEIQMWSNAFMNHIVPAYYRSALFPLALDAWRLDAYGEYLETPGDHHGFPEITLRQPPERSTASLPDYEPAAAGQPLWVSRSLHVDGVPFPRRQAILRHWAPAAMGDIPREEQTEFVYLGWGHNVFHTPHDSALAHDAWEALLLCQYFYTVLQSSNLGLTRFIGLSLGQLSHRETQKLDRVLQDVVASVNLIVTEFNDTQQNLQGHRQAFFKDLRVRWSMDTLLQNVEKKIGLVTDQINRLYEKSVKTGQALNGLILCAIGGIALISFCLSLSQYARSPVVHPDQGPAADGVWGLLDIAAAYPPDVVIWGGVILLAGLLGMFWLFQRRGA
jgi:hypothetical protein